MTDVIRRPGHYFVCSVAEDARLAAFGDGRILITHERTGHAYLVRAHGDRDGGDLVVIVPLILVPETRQ